jgi:hypothetical protein
VLKRNDGSQFDQRLVRRFVQIIGIYPVGNVVRLDTNELAVVLRVNADDPHKPQVRVVLDREGRKYLRPYDVNLWQSQPGGRWPCSITGPVDPADTGLDPLSLL